MYESGAGWAEPVLVRLLPAPPDARVVHPGGRNVSVAATGPRGRQVTNSGVVLAWARLPRDGWAMLFVWSGNRRTREGRQVLSARWSWCWVGRREVYVHEPVKSDNPWGMAWYGHRHRELEAAIAEAIDSLPARARMHAAVPVARKGLLRLESLNPRVVFTPRWPGAEASAERGFGAALRLPDC